MCIPEPCEWLPSSIHSFPEPIMSAAPCPPPQRSLFDPVVNEIVEISNKQLKLAAEQQGLPSGAHKVWGFHTY